jgi:predicted transcriptional regulator
MKKDEVRRLIDKMPDDATLEDLIREIYVIEAVEKGLADSAAGRVTDVGEIRKKYGLYQ